MKVSDVTGTIFVRWIAENFNVLFVEDVFTTITPYKKAVCFHFCYAVTASSSCFHHLDQCCYCWWCSRESCAVTANGALSTFFVSSEARPNFVL